MRCYRARTRLKRGTRSAWYWRHQSATLFVALVTFACQGTRPRDVTRTAPTAVERADPTRHLTAEEAVADVGELVDFIDRTHPDPYGTDGKLAVQLRVHRLLGEIPAEGLTVGELHSLMQPLLVALSDAHTRVHPLRSVMEGSGHGIAVDFKILAESESEPVPTLFVQGARGMDLVGARIEAVEGVPIADLIRRSRLWDGYENEFGNLQNLLRRLGSKKGLKELLPEWEGGDSVRVSLRNRDGVPEEVALPLGEKPAPWEGPVGATAVTLPDTRAGTPAYRFMDANRQTALLRLDNTWAYRETFESLTKLDEGNLDWARAFYRQYRAEEPPMDTTALVSAMPSAVQILSDLAEAMRTAGTQRLVVDLRRNSGGTSMLVDMLLYFLYGRAAWTEFYGNFHTIRRLTPDDLKGFDSSITSRFPYRVGDYDFSQLRDREAENGEWNEAYWKRVTTSFAAELECSCHERHYLPPDVIVVVSPATYSGGFWIAAGLHRLGAKLVGVPSAQAGNAYGHVKYTTLTNSGIRVGVSSRRFVLFPENPDGMGVLPVDLPLTEERWREAGYDPNASLLLATAVPG